MPMLDKQRRGQVIGRIRTGYKNPAGQPVKSKTLIFTTGNRRAAAEIAGLYGGEVKPWDVQAGQFIVRTTVAEIDVVIPPRDSIISQWYEMWTAAGCARRCDSVTNTITGEACPCPSDPEERARLAAKKKPEACKPRTRINVMIPDVPGMGVWTLATGSDQAACEVNDSADLMEMARDQGLMLPATLRLEQRETRTVGEATKQYGVPVLEPHNTFRQIASGELENGHVLAQLPPVPAARLALTAGTSEPMVPRVDRSEPVAGPPTAQQLADRAVAATTRAQVEHLVAEAERYQLGEDLVMVDGAEEELMAFLRYRWKSLGAADGGSPPEADLAHAAMAAAHSGGDDFDWPDTES